MDQERREELLELYPGLKKDELEEIDRNLKAYARILAKMFFRLRREGKLEKLIEEHRKQKKFDSQQE